MAEEEEYNPGAIDPSYPHVKDAKGRYFQVFKDPKFAEVEPEVEGDPCLLVPFPREYDHDATLSLCDQTNAKD